MDLAELLAPCIAAIGTVSDPLRQLQVLKDELAKACGKLNGQAEHVDRQAVFDAITASGAGKDLCDSVGSGTVHIAIASAFREQAANGHAEITERLAIPLNEFTKNLEPIDFLVDEILLTGCVYALTAKPGSGKTTITILLSICVSQGLKFAGRDVDQGSVLYFAGENPDDIKRRFLAACQRSGVHDDEITNIFIVPGAYRFSEIGDRIRGEMKDGVKLVIVDTSAVYYEGDDENDNVQMSEHALRMRELLACLPGKPTVIINCHPARNATDENMVPRGGGGFEAAIDGNLYCKKVDVGLTVHHTAKFRGVEFEPLNFQIISVTHERVKTVRGKLIHIPVAEHVSEQRMEEIETNKRSDEDHVLVNIRDHQEISLGDRAKLLGWLLGNGTPNKMRVKRAIASLEADGLVGKFRDGYEVNAKGKKVCGENDT